MFSSGWSGRRHSVFTQMIWTAFCRADSGYRIGGDMAIGSPNFIHSFNKYFSSTSCVSGAVLRAEDVGN